MSPGSTFERVHRELKRRLASGSLAPGSPLEPAVLGSELAASITPVRDALHRLVGERLVEAPQHNGFHVPQLTEAGLRDLYSWNGQLLGLAARHLAARPDAVARTEAGDVPGATAGLFAQIARQSGSGEHLRAVEQLNDRLAAFRLAEADVLPSLTAELEGLVSCCRSGNRKELAGALTRYHRRRIAAVSQILELLCRPRPAQGA
jgi:hypothetical protein